VIAAFITRLVDFSRRHAAAHALAALALTLLAAWYAAGHLSVNTDIEKLLPSDLPWRQNEIALDRAFPQNANQLAIVIDGQTGSLADDAAQRLAERLAAEPQFFRNMRRPDGGAFFDQNGLLFLSVDELNALSQQLVSAQPLIGSLSADPSLRGLFDTLKLFVEGAGRGDVGIDKLAPTLAKIADVVDGVAAGRTESLSWQQVLSGKPDDKRDLRHFVLAQPVLDYTAITPASSATGEIRRLVHDLGLEPQNGVRVRITGSPALDDEQFKTLKEGALRSTLLSVGGVLVILLVGLRSPRLVIAILATVFSGLVLTAGFAALAIGSLNVISVAFGVLFVGLAVDFSIQFSIRYRDQRHRLGTLDKALAGAAATIGPSLALAAASTAIGFLSFVPTPYVGVRELGWIAGAGMVIAIALNFLLLPALLTLLRPRAEPEAIGFARAAPLDRLLRTRRRWVLGGTAVLALAGLAAMPGIRFDFDPINLKDPNSEAMQTALDLMRDPQTTPYTAEILSPSLEAATALADRLAELPEVEQAVTAEGFIPTHQDEKLAILSDLTLLLGPSLAPATTQPAPSDAEVMASLAACRDALRKFADAHPDAPGAGPVGRLAAALDTAAARGPQIIPELHKALLSGLLHRLEVLGRLLQAKPVTLADLPQDLRASWIAPDGKARIEVFPKGSARDPKVLEDFVAAVHRVAPQATGTPVTIQEAGRLISSAFVEAGVIAVAAIMVLLAVVLRDPRDVALVIAPLLLAALLTLAVTVAIGMKLNYANIIALPLLLGIGVAFDIYFVMNWRAGLSDHLQSSTARAVVFSALTTLCAFGSLALSPDPGSSEMGKLLAISLAMTVLCTLFILPALLGPAPVTAPDRGSVPAPGPVRRSAPARAGSAKPRAPRRGGSPGRKKRARSRGGNKPR
jgi:hopanoid biosynthesis associated RND transporter like protein HpnN